MPALPSSLIEPLWDQFEALIPPVQDNHPLGCHRPRVPARIVFEKLVARLVLGGSYTKHADHRVSATTLRARRDEWITGGVFTALEQHVLEAFDWLIGLDLEHLSVDGCCVKAPCGGDNTGPNPTDRGKSGQKRSVLTEGHGLPVGVVIAGANRHDSRLLESSLECLSRFGFHLPERIRVDLDAGYDSKKTRDTLDRLGCEHRISPKGEFIKINHTRRWKVERVNSWHTRGFGLLQVVLDRSAPVQQAWIQLANTIIVLKRLLKETWPRFRWDSRPVKQYQWR
ncbi:IS5 family transposase [Nesterenkonia salmonea]|uniref:IS5 family transposase n=1 Tax=Nesterenkonia salmonea TaxID=1804987 RepID=A0A5R9B5A5_9MICC|nr:IS5 family transposase [Nesterenkonia salmonea]TLP90229.1 IS5 family transposase [Nesterenkonia salmonea]